MDHHALGRRGLEQGRGLVPCGRGLNEDHRLGGGIG